MLCCNKASYTPVVVCKRMYYACTRTVQLRIQLFRVTLIYHTLISPQISRCKKFKVLSNILLYCFQQSVLI